MSIVIQASVLALNTPESVPEDTRLIVTCRIGDQYYGLPIEAVREVVRLPALLTLAGAPPFICGLLNLRGNYISIFNGRVLIGETPQYELSNQIIIIGQTEPEFGLLVDRVLEVYTLHVSQWKPVSQHTAAAFLQGVFHTNTHSVILFDTAALQALMPANSA